MAFCGGVGVLAWAVVTLRRTAERTAAIEARLDGLQGEVAALRAATAPGTSGSAPPAQVPADTQATAGTAVPPVGPPVSHPPSPSAAPERAAAAPSARDSRPPGAWIEAPEQAEGATPPAFGAPGSAAAEPSTAAAPSTTAAPPTTPAAPAPRRIGLEERLGARLPVWIGAVALALAGAFLVKYSVDQGWIGPTVRVLLAAAFGLALLAGGQLLRRATAPIAGALAAAGVAVLYADILAAVRLYHLVSDASGFVLLVLVTAAAIGLALVHGPIVAVVGLVGGFLTPAWIHLGEPDPKSLFTYLLLLHLSVVAVSRRRSWPSLSTASLAGGFLWVVAFLVGGFEPGDGPWMQLFLLCSLVTWGGSLVQGREEGEVRVPASVVWIVAGAALASFATITSVSRFGLLEWGMAGLLVAGLLVLDRFVEGFRDLSWLAAAVVEAMLAGWAFTLGDWPQDLGRFLITAASMTGLVAGGAWAALWGSERPGRWASLSASAGIALPVIAWLGWRAAASAEPRVPWSVVALLLAGLFLLALLPVARRCRTAGSDDSGGFGRGTAMNAALAALAVGATAHLTWAAALGLEREVLTLALALEVPALVWLAVRFRLAVLVRLAAALAAGAAVRLLFNPWLIDAVAGQPPVLNSLLWTYGGALVAFGLAVVALEGRPGGDGAAGERPNAPRLGSLLRWLCMALLLELVTWEVLHAFAPGASPLAAASSLAVGHGLVRFGAVAVAWLVVGLGLLLGARRWPDAFAAAGYVGSRLILLLGLAAAVLGPSLVLNPVWRGDRVGSWPLFNHLLWIYGAPALLLALAVRSSPPEPGDTNEQSLVAALGVGALLLLFTLVTLEVLQGFRGTVLDRPSPHPYAEGWALSAAWLLLGTVLLLAGIATNRRLLRAAALAVTGIAVVKVFLFDIGRLGDLYRVLSFLGLGLSLLLLAWLYQRFVFRSGKDSEPPAA